MFSDLGSPVCDFVRAFWITETFMILIPIGTVQCADILCDVLTFSFKNPWEETRALVDLSICNGGELLQISKLNLKLLNYHKLETLQIRIVQ